MHAICPQSATSMTDTTLLQQALQLHEQWKYEAARQAYAQVLAQEPGHVQALYGMGLLLGQHMLRSAEALPYLEAAIDANPRAFVYWRTYINMLIREGLLDMASSLIGMAREQGMQEIALVQLEKDLALSRGEEAAAFLEEQAALLSAPAPKVRVAAAAQPSLPPGPSQALAQLLQQRNFSQADEKLTALMRQYPRSALLWHARINLEQERGRPAAALQAAAQAVRRLPEDAGLLLLQGELLLEGRQPEHAESSFRKALVLQPQSTKIYWLLGDALFAQGKGAEAYPWYVHALLRAEDEDSQTQAQVRLIEALHADGRSWVCAQLLALLMQQPNRSARLYRTGGDVLRTLGWHLQAEMAYRMALQVQPGWRPALIGLHEALNKDSSRMAERATCLRQILAQEDLSAEMRLNIRSVLADVYFKQGDWSACEQTLDEIQAEDETAVHVHRLRCWMAMERNDLEAMDAALREALRYWPDEHDLMQAQAIYWSRRGDVQRGMAQYDALLAKYPHSAVGHSGRLLTMAHQPGVSPAQIGEACRAYGRLMQSLHGAAEDIGHANAKDPDKVLRVGFVSADLRHHAAAKFFMPVMRDLAGRRDMECIAYCNNEVHDAVTNEFMALFQQWRGVREMSTEAMTHLVREDGIDILIDLSGHTAGQRLDVFACRPAPLQLTWIGNPGSTGLQTMDYMVLSDLLLDGHAVRQQLTEHMLRLPLAYVFEGGIHAEPVAPLPALRKGHLTFGSFNRLVKVNREVVAVWAQVLRSIPDARLVIGACEPSGPPAHLIQWLQQEGIAAERLSFVARSGFADYLKAHGDIDICLDTFPFTGGVVTNHALWMGVPTLTLVGDLLGGRQSAEVLARVGLAGDFAARDLQELLNLARYWNGHLEQLADIRQALRGALQAQESSQAGVVSQALAMGLRKAWSRWCKGEAAADLCVSYEDLGLEAPETRMQALLGAAA